MAATVWIAALFTALTILLAFPLSVTPHRTLPADDPDGHLFMWTLAWDTYALVRQPLSLFDANIFYPLPNALAYSENLIGSTLFAAPVLWLTGNPVLAVNAVSLLSCILCGVGAYVLGRRLGLSVAGAAVAGVIFAFSPPRFLRFSQLHLTVVQWIPFALASLHGYLDTGRRRDLLLAAAFTTLQVLSTGHGGVFLLLAIVLLLAYRVALGEPLLPGRRLRDLGVLGVLLLVPNVLLALQYRRAQVDVNLRRSLGSWDTPIENFFASPTPVDMFLRSLVTDRDVNAAATAWLFPGFLPLGLAALAVLCAAIAFVQFLRRPKSVHRTARAGHSSGFAGLVLPPRLTIAAAVVFVAFTAARPSLDAGTGLTSSDSGDGTIVQTGYLTVGEPALYNFGVTAEDRSRLAIDNVQVIDFGTHNPVGAPTGSVRLAEGPHRVVLESRAGRDQRAVAWLWSTDAEGGGYAAVPAWRLSRRPVGYASAVAVRLLDVFRYAAATLLVIVLVSAVAGWVLRRREAWSAWGLPYRHSPTAFYLLLTTVCVALALGPPYGAWQFVYWWPGLNFIRVSSRFMVLGLLGVAVLGGIGFDRLTSAWGPRRRWAGVMAGALLVGEFAMIPYRGVPYRLQIPAADRWLATQAKPFALAEVPVTWSERYHSNYMLHSMAHWQPTVNGYSGIRPVLHEELYEQLKTFPNEESLRNLTTLGVRYVVVHASWYIPEEWSLVEQRLPAFDSWLTLEYMDADSRVYSVHPPARQEP